MKVYQQSPELKAIFQTQVNEKVSNNRQAVSEAFGGGILGGFGTMMYDFRQAKNQFKGWMGEGFISLLLTSLPDTWILFNNAFIPTTSGKLTEIDHLIIGMGGIFLVEVKTWKGSYSAYKDNWKRRDGSQWIPVSNSPTSQSMYHQKGFTQWLRQQLPSFPDLDNLMASPVVFPVAKWVGVTDCSVPVLTNAMSLVKVLANSPQRLTPAQVEEVAQAVIHCSPTPPQPSSTPKPTPTSKPVKTISRSTPEPKPKPVLKKSVPKPIKRNS